MHSLFLSFWILFVQFMGLELCQFCRFSYTKLVMPMVHIVPKPTSTVRYIEVYRGSTGAAVGRPGCVL